MNTPATTIARWHPANKGDVLSIPKLRVTDNKWGQTLPAVDGASFANMHGEWLVDDIRYSPRNAVIRRARQTGAIQFVQPYVDHAHVTGCPPPFNPEWAAKVRDIARMAYKDLRGFLRMSAAELDTIHWVLDHEQWDMAPYTKADGARETLYVGRTYSEKPLVRPWAEHAIDWTVWALREAGFGGPITNHATGVATTHSRCAQTRHPALTMPHLASYAHEELIYDTAEVMYEMDAMKKAGEPFVYTHHAKSDPRLIDRARATGCVRVLLWN